ncbi:MAG TPA: hypothetical protein ENH94_00060 [Phycisphaerales bacterium]|nr:hypothetical protein [Phycisphaerales bacterium]
MSTRQNFRNIVVCQLFIVFGFTGICLAADSRQIDEGEKSRLYNAWERNKSRMTLPIDVTFSKKTINSPHFTELREKERQQKNEKQKKVPEKSKRILGTFGFMSSKKEEFFLYKLRVRMDGFSKYRADVIVFGDEKKEKERYNASHINNSETGIKIDHKRKLASINDKYNWGGSSRDVLTYGTFLGYGRIAGNIWSLCRANRPNADTANKEFRHKGVVKIGGKDAVVIELFDLKKKYSVYEMSLDVDDWGKCYKFVEYRKDGICEKQISEFSKFLKDKKSGILYPRFIVETYFDDKCKEKKRDIISIIEVNLGLPIPDDVFELNVGEDYTIMDHRINPILRIAPKAEGKTENEEKESPDDKP